MPDPVTFTAAASVPLAVWAGLAGSAVAAFIAGPDAVTMAAFGVGAKAISLGLAGSVLGVTFAEPASFGHGLARFVASAIVSAVIGTAAGQQLALSVFMTNAAICGTGTVLHLGLSWIGKRFGKIADAGARRVGIDVGE